ncbi:MAG: TPR end-of-group domain-containing protein, partial [Pyrinomonadaceae bacterium]
YYSGFRFKGMVALIIVVVLFAGAFLYFRTNRVYGVAVLPFANETADAGFDYLADGMAESLSRKLVGTNGFRSITYSKLAGLTSADGDANLIGRNVQADLVLTGRIYRDAGSLSVETTLSDTSDGSVLRLASQELSLGDIQTVESSLLERMFAGPEIRTFAELGNANRITGRAPKPEAFQQYLIGRHHWRKRDRENIEKAITAFQRAIDLDASYSQAWAGLADSFILQSSVAYGSTPAKDSFAKARAAAKEAIKIDPLNAEAHTSLCIVLTKQDWNWQEAEREYRIALDIDPDYGPAHFWYASLLGITGRRVESIASAEKAKELDPFSPLVEYNLARTYYYARQYDRALEVLNAQTAAPKNEEKILYMAGLIYLQKGMQAEALKVFQDVSAKNRMLGIAAVGYTYGRMGRRKEALNIIADLERSSTGSYIPPQELALIYIGLNERDKAFHYLNKTFEERYGAFTSLKVEPLFDPIRDDPRFAALLQQMALN